MYNKIFTKILDSSIWLEPDATRIVWVTCIAAMDEDGFCQFASPANLAHRANVTLEACAAALACLEGEDANSSDPENDGRRLERVPGGWIVLNAAKYRELVTRVARQTLNRERVRKHRELKRTGNALKQKRNAPVMQSEAYTEALSGSEEKNTPTASSTLETRFAAFWKCYPKKTGKDAALKAWKKRAPSEDLLNQMLAVLAWQKTSEQWTKDRGQYVPNPATWLNEGRFQDEPIDVPTVEKPFTREEVADAKRIRAIRFGCSHDPRCSDATSCEAVIIREKRARA